MAHYYFDRLSQKHRAVYLKLIDAIKKRGAVLEVWDESLDIDGADAIYRAVNLDHPELFYVNLGQINLTRYSNGKRELQIHYYFNRNECDHIVRLVEQKLSQLLLAAPVGANSTPWEKCKWIHDYLVRRVTYGEDKPAFAGHPETVYNALGALLAGRAVCEGISKAATLLGDRLGVELIGVSGDARNSKGITEPHAWNLARLNNMYSHMDITWDLNLSAESELIRYDYFCIPDKYIRVNHFYSGTPICAVGSGLSYFEKNHRLFNNMAQCEQFVDSCLRRNEKVMYFQYMPGADTPVSQSAMTEMIKRTIKKYYRQSYNLSYNQMSSMNVFYYRLKLAS